MSITKSRCKLGYVELCRAFLVALLGVTICAHADIPVTGERAGQVVQVRPGSSANWGYLVGPNGAPVPIKGTYFFPGDAYPDTSTYTFYPISTQKFNLTWSQPSSGSLILNQMSAAGVNVIVMSYYGRVR